MLLAAHLLGDQISLLNWLGFALCLSGISLHIALKALHARGTQSPLSEACLLVTLSPWISPLPIPARRQVALNPPGHLQSSLLSSAAPALAVPLARYQRQKDCLLAHYSSIVLPVPDRRPIPVVC